MSWETIDDDVTYEITTSISDLVFTACTLTVGSIESCSSSATIANDTLVGQYTITVTSINTDSYLTAATEKIEIIEALPFLLATSRQIADYNGDDIDDYVH